MVVWDTVVEVLDCCSYDSEQVEPRGGVAEGCEGIASTLRDNPDIRKVALSGHADPTESRPQALSLARAKLVFDCITQAGVEPERLVIVAYGADEPVSSNDTAAGRAKNRRLDFEILQRAGEPPPPPVRRVAVTQAGCPNMVATYLTDAEVQCESCAGIERALRDMAFREPAVIQKARYPNYQEQPGKWDLRTMFQKHIMPGDDWIEYVRKGCSCTDEPECFLREASSDAARLAARQLLR